MPTENERKFVLTLECENEISELEGDVYLLRQGYLAFSKGMSLRVRSAEPISKKGKKKYRLCYKQKVNGRVIEIEKKIDARDFDDLWSVSLSKLEKERHVISFNKAIWEVDFFKTAQHETYFALAEHEMPEGQLAPSIIPSIIRENLLHIVPLDDDGYSSKRLACVRHARKTYKQFIENGEVQEV